MKQVLPVNKLVFLDETGTNIGMDRAKGWAPKGTRAKGVRPFRNWKNYTTVGAIRLSGPVAKRTFDGAMNLKRFTHYVRADLAPRLRRDDVVVMDNLGSHYAPEALAAIEAAGAHVLFLPPYSPDWNPIEKAWFMFKNILRRIKARSPEALRRAIRRAWSKLKKSNLAPVFDHCGYGSSKAQPN